MGDHGLVAAIVGGDLDAVGEAFDQYAAPLYASCLTLLPDSRLAEAAVLDTFLVATERLSGLRDTARLGPWLHAVARNECLRRGAAASAADSAAGAAAAAAYLPGELRGKVLAACADNSPAGRAYRVSAAHRAGSFGANGFPRGPAPSGPRWWHPLRRHRRIVAAAAAAVIVAAAALATVLVTTDSAARTASATTLGSELPGSAHGASAAANTSPSRSISPTASSPGPTVTATASIQGTVSSTGRATPHPPSSAPTSPATSPGSSSPSPSASTSPPPTPGTLSASPASLSLTAAKGETASGTFLISAQGGPVSDYTIGVPSWATAKITVSPTGGSLKAGGWVTVTVTVTSKTSVKGNLTVDPGSIKVAVKLTIKA